MDVSSQDAASVSDADASDAAQELFTDLGLDAAPDLGAIGERDVGQRPPPDVGLGDQDAQLALDAAPLESPDIGFDLGGPQPDMALDRDAGAMEGPAWIYPPCELACCPGFPWRRPGGFWSDLAGHLPDWRPVADAPCVFALMRDECLIAATMRPPSARTAKSGPTQRKSLEQRRQPASVLM